MIGGLIVGVSMLGLGCPKPRPPQPPKPPIVEPAGPPYAVERVTDTLRSAPGGKGWQRLDGSPVSLTWAYSCCTESLAGAFGWPGYNRNWIDYLKPLGVNAVHYRVGPFVAADEVNYASIGGAYAEVNGKADLDNWNPKFWQYARDVIGYAVAQGFWVEVDLADGWGCKEGGYEKHPWDSRWNIQGEDARTTCGVAVGPRHAAFIAKVVDELGSYGPILLQDGNEIGIVGWGYKPEWTFGLQRIVREREAANHYPVHLFGTNSGKAEAIDSPLIDYVTTHERVLIDRPIAAKPTVQNEHNPEYPEDVEYAAFCAAKAGGADWGLWAAGMERPAFTALLERIKAGCGGYSGDSCPFEVPRIGAIQAKDHYSAPGKILLDATPLVMGDGGYCRRAGFTDGRSNCPVRQEGDAFREQCESAAMGGEISWSLPAGSPLTLNDRHAGFQAEVTGPSGALGEVYCTTPKAGGANLCARPLSAGGGPVVVTIP